MADDEGNVSDVELERALHQIDLTRLGMAGNLKDFKMVDFEGNTQVGSSIDYNGQEAGYAEQPWEVQNYVSKHDNQTFWDINMYKVSEDASVDGACSNADHWYVYCATRSSDAVQPHGW